MDCPTSALGVRDFFCCALTESLVLGGLFVPGALVMFGVGAVVAASSLDLRATLA